MNIQKKEEEEAYKKTITRLEFKIDNYNKPLIVESYYFANYDTSEYENENLFLNIDDFDFTDDQKELLENYLGDLVSLDLEEKITLD